MTDLDEVLDRLADRIADRIAARLTAIQAPADDRLIGPRDAGVPARTWRAAIRRGELLGVRVGRQYLASRAAVDLWLGQCVVAPARLTPTAASDNVDQEIGALLRAGKLRAIK